MMIRVAQLLLVLAALALWGASRLPWVQVTSFDGLGQPKTVILDGATWVSALTPLALLLVAAAVAVLAVRGWPLRALAVLVALASGLTAYLAITQWVMRDVSIRGAGLAEVTVASLVDSQRFYWGAVLALAAAVVALAGAVLLIRSAGTARAATTKYRAPAARRAAAQDDAVRDTDDGMSERMIWDALDQGRDPTAGPGPEKEGR
ncbi:trp region conserved hypothetical membrane protein [Mycolicibacterium tokaiense]|uniref:Trp region conserved hypothetical membrane protein n=2 Tax=Mycolicibacterium tokaiense TaxID=39695 RepID=A0A378T7A6_9MYCO|nr:membrane protein [Mycolicibacterium tokaiense]STZ56711.1 trp region conserved hypothetical membrane protein [Mycolicibacterium tokaiense]